MNPVAWVHIAAALLVVAVAIPLVRRKVKMNSLYGVRVPKAFISEKAWYELNAFGGRLMLAWAAGLAAIAAAGLFLPRRDWLRYDWGALAYVFGGLLWIAFAIARFAPEEDDEDGSP